MRAAAIFAAVAATSGALAGQAGEARAELWGSSMGGLLESATRVEVVQVDGVKDRQLSGRVVEAFRSTARVGDAIQIDLGWLPTPAVNDHVLIVCDDMCPRAIGVQDHGVFRMVAQQPMDGAMLWPNLVVRGSLTALTAGRGAPDLCVRGAITLVDQAKPESFTAALSAYDGKGHGALTSGAVDAAIGSSFAALGDGGLTVTLARNGHSLQLATDRVAIAGDGCIEATFAPLRPMARTSRSLEQVLTGHPSASVIARGTLVVAPGAAGGQVKAGKHVLTLSVDHNGELVLAGDLASGRLTSIDMTRTVRIGFSSPSSPYPQMRIDLGTAPSGIGPAAAALASLASGSADLSVAWLTTPPPDGNLVETALGTVHFTYVPEKWWSRRSITRLPRNRSREGLP